VKILTKHNYYAVELYSKYCFDFCLLEVIVCPAQLLVCKTWKCFLFSTLQLS